jgi:trans-2-enoyl-CoA reductase
MIVFGLLDLQRESQFDVRKMLFYNLSLQGFWIPGWWFSTDLVTRTDAVNKTFDLIRNGNLITPIEKEYTLSEINQAVVHAEKAGNNGRVTLIC